MSQVTSETQSGFEVNGKPWDVADRMLLGGPLSTLAEDYYGDPANRDIMPFVALASRLLVQHSTEAYRACPEPEVVIPVLAATHQEMATIGPSLETYAKQRKPPPYRVVLFCNAPMDAPGELINETLGTVEDFATNHPEIPFGYFATEFRKVPELSLLRRYNWDTALLDQRALARTDDILVLNHDADITSMDRDHLRRLNDVFREPRAAGELPATMIYPRHNHQHSGGQLPNIDSVIAWQDFSALLNKGYYEMGVGLSARAYFAAGGFARGYTNGEMLQLIQRIHQSKGIEHPGQRRVEAARIASSSRRLQVAVASGVIISRFWSCAMGPSNSYRTRLVDDIQDIGELERDYYIKSIVGSMPGSICDYFVERGRAKYGDGPLAYEYAESWLRTVQAFLGGSLPMSIADQLTQ